MDNHTTSLLNWAYYYQGKTMEELGESLLYTSLELEQTRLVVQEELRKKDDQLMNLKDLVTKIMKERDEAKEKFQKLVLQAVAVAPPLSGISSIEDEPKRGIDSKNGFSSSECEESIVSSPVLELLSEKPLPEKGKLLQAVMKAGPLLQTLLLAGPLPQWKHPPPPLNSFEIPPVTIPLPPHLDPNIINNSCAKKLNMKRVHHDGSDSSSSPTQTKYQRVVLH